MSTEEAGEPIPEEVAAWLEASIGPWVMVSDASWPKSSSRVWHIRVAGSEAFLKISPSIDQFRREHSAYSDLLPHSSATTPALIASSRDLLALVTSGVDGKVVRTLNPAPSLDVERVIHAHAGAAARSVHELAHVETDRARAERVTRLLDAAEERMPLCRPLLGVDETTSITLARQSLARSAVDCEMGFIHGDFQPRNWLWSPSTRELGLIDFEESGSGFCVEDFGWLLAARWRHRPDLRDVFLTGYGRVPSDAEFLFLASFTVLGSLQYLADGHRQAIDAKIANGREALAVASELLGELTRPGR